MKKVVLLASFVASVLLFAACGSDTTTSSSASSTSSSAVASSTTTETSAATASTDSSEVASSQSSETMTADTSSTSETNLWTSEKAATLADFMKSWGNTMGQEYHAYEPGNNVNFYGVTVPDKVLDKSMQMVVDKQEIPIQWSTTGMGAGYQLVAVYSDAKTGSFGAMHLYFFVLVDGQPKVYVTEQNQGNEQNYLYFHETDNQELKDSFENLFK